MSKKDYLVIAMIGVSYNDNAFYELEHELLDIRVPAENEKEALSVASKMVEEHYASDTDVDSADIEDQRIIEIGE